MGHVPPCAFDTESRPFFEQIPNVMHNWVICVVNLGLFWFNHCVLFHISTVLYQRFYACRESWQIDWTLHLIRSLFLNNDSWQLFIWSVVCFWTTTVDDCTDIRFGRHSFFFAWASTDFLFSGLIFFDFKNRSKSWGFVRDLLALVFLVWDVGVFLHWMQWNFTPNNLNPLA